MILLRYTQSHTLAPIWWPQPLNHSFPQTISIEQCLSNQQQININQNKQKQTTWHQNKPEGIVLVVKEGMFLLLTFKVQTLESTPKEFIKFLLMQQAYEGVQDC